MTGRGHRHEPHASARHLSRSLATADQRSSRTSLTLDDSQCRTTPQTISFGNSSPSYELPQWLSPFVQEQLRVNKQIWTSDAQGSAMTSSRERRQRAKFSRSESASDWHPERRRADVDAAGYGIVIHAAHLETCSPA